MGKRMKGTENVPARRVSARTRVAEQLGRRALEVLSEVPDTLEMPARNTTVRARAVVRAASNKAALAAGGLALPPGPLGWLTIVPELVTIWRIQAQMVSDLAGVYGVSAWLTREQMIQCLFRHAAAQALRDVVARVGSRVVAHDLPVHVLQRIARAIGLQMSRRALGSSVSRWLPMVGAVGVGTYAWYDTRQVAHAAMALFAREAAESAQRESAVVAQA